MREPARQDLKSQDSPLRAAGSEEALPKQWQQTHRQQPTSNKTQQGREGRDGGAQVASKLEGFKTSCLGLTKASVTLRFSEHGQTLSEACLLRGPMTGRRTLSAMQGEALGGLSGMQCEAVPVSAGSQDRALGTCE